MCKFAQIEIITETSGGYFINDFINETSRRFYSISKTGNTGKVVPTTIF